MKLATSAIVAAVVATVLIGLAAEFIRTVLLEPFARLVAI